MQSKSTVSKVEEFVPLPAEVRRLFYTLLRNSKHDVEYADVAAFTKVLRENGVRKFHLARGAQWHLAFYVDRAETLLGSDEDFDTALDKLLARFDVYRNAHQRDVMLPETHLF